MRIVIAGQGDVGLPLAATALRRKHEVVGYDTIPEHMVRLFGQVQRNELPDGLSVAFNTGRYRLVLGEDDLPEFDAAVFTPNCMVNDEPHTIWTRFAREMRGIGTRLRPGNLVVLHCASLQGTAMMHDARRMLETWSGMDSEKDFCLAWTGLVNGEYKFPESQELFVAGVNETCEQKAIALMQGITGPVVTLAEMEKYEIA